MIAAETLIAPRSPDAPAVVPAVARSGEPSDFARVLAQSVKQAAATPDVPALAAGTHAAIHAADVPLSQPGLADTGMAPANPDHPALAAFGLAPPTVVPSAVIPSALIPSTVPSLGGPATALNMTGSGADPTPADPAFAADPAAAAPAAAAAKDAVAPAANALPLAPAPSTAPVPAEPTQAAPETESGKKDAPTEATAPATAKVEVAAKAPAPAQADAEPATDSDGTDSVDTDAPEAAPPSEPPPAAAEQPVILPPLTALIQPLITPPNGPDGDPEAKPQAEVNGSAPRPRGMAGRLAMLTDAQNPAQTQESTPGFAPQMNQSQSQGPQDHLPPQSDVAQTAMAERDAAFTDMAAETSGAATATPQPLPADTRATATPAPTPQRLPESAPLDTTRSGWEAALTERITARNTDLGQEIEITLTPENLGHIRIKLDLTDKAATVQIVTDTPQAAQLFQQSETRLADALNRAGLSLTSHDASSRDQAGREGGQNGQRQGQNPGNPRAEAALAGLRGTLAAPSAGGRAANLVNIVA